MEVDLSGEGRRLQEERNEEEDELGSCEPFERERASEEKKLTNMGKSPLSSILRRASTLAHSCILRRQKGLEREEGREGERGRGSGG